MTGWFGSKSAPNSKASATTTDSRTYCAASASPNKLPTPNSTKFDCLRQPNSAKGAPYDTQGKREAGRLHQTARRAQSRIARGKHEARRLHQTAPKAQHMIARGKREARRLHQTALKARHMIA